MKELERYDWMPVLRNEAFIKLQRKKTVLLFTLWFLGMIPYLLLILGAACQPEVPRLKLQGNMSLGYAFCMFQLFSMIAISIYYNCKTTKDFRSARQGA